MSAHPKIQKMCEEESDDHEAVAKLFEINDSINRTIERYKLIKKGDVEGAAKIPKGTLGTSGAGVSKGPNNELSLIDFGGPEDEISATPAAATSVPAPRPTGSALEDDLLGLSMSSDDSGQGAIALGSSNGFGRSYSRKRSDTTLTEVLGGGPSSQGHHLSNAQIAGLYQQTSSAPQAFNPPSLFSSLSAQPPSQSLPKPADPFAALASSSDAPRQSSPFQFQQSTQPPSIFAAKSPQPPFPSSLSAAPPQTAAAADDEWNFESALPPSVPSALTLTNSSVTIAWELSRPADQQGVIEINSRVTNNTSLPVSEFTFQVAVTKVKAPWSDAGQQFANMI
jgi:ADP-ribosylation factor-binding protein GGA